MEGKGMHSLLECMEPDTWGPHSCQVPFVPKQMRQRMNGMHGNKLGRMSVFGTLIHGHWFWAEGRGLRKKLLLVTLALCRSCKMQLLHFRMQCCCETHSNIIGSCALKRAAAIFFYPCCLVMTLHSGAQWVWKIAPVMWWLQIWAPAGSYSVTFFFKTIQNEEGYKNKVYRYGLKWAPSKMKFQKLWGF